MGGAKNCPETPRQKMIGMMYLVLTAMLALNVSAEIINGFDKIRISMESSMVSTEKRTKDTYAMFQAEYEKDDAGRAKYGDWWEIAQACHNKSEEFYNYIENFKLDIANMVDSKKGDEAYKKMPKEVKGGSDTNKPHQYALNETGESGLPHAEEFEKRMVEYREYMTVIESPCIKAKMTDEKFAHDLNLKFEMFKTLFNTDPVVNKEGKTITWAEETFHEMPASAVLALLTKYQNDVRMAENDMINFMWQSAGSSKFVANAVVAMVRPENGTYVMQGQRYRARVFSGAIDTTNVPQVFFNGQEVEGGVIDFTATGVGEHRISGYILMPGDTTQYPFEDKYTVGQPSAAVANLDMNVLYSGYNNRLSVSVPGYGDDKVSIECADAISIKRDGTAWIVDLKKCTKTNIVVYAMSDGRKVQQASQEFRVKVLPAPQPFVLFGGKQLSGEIPANFLSSGKASIVASYGADSDLKAKFTVESFAVKFPSGKEEICQGAKFSKNAITTISKLKPGSPLTVKKVIVKDEKGNKRELPDWLSIELK